MQQFVQWATAFEFHTPPVKDLSQAFREGDVNFKWMNPLTGLADLNHLDLNH